MYKIYKLIDNTNDNIYVGITKKKYLSYRLSHHKYEYKIERRRKCMSREIIKNGDYKIELIEETYDKLRERYWIEKLNCVNKVIPYRTKEEQKRYKKLWMKQYSEKNKDKIIQKQKQYYENNKGKILEQRKNYYNSKNSWGGDYRYNNNLLRIDINLFLN